MKGTWKKQTSATGKTKRKIRKVKNGTTRRCRIGLLKNHERDTEETDCNNGKEEEKNKKSKKWKKRERNEHKNRCRTEKGKVVGGGRQRWRGGCRGCELKKRKSPERTRKKLDGRKIIAGDGSCRRLDKKLLLTIFLPL